MKVYVVNWFDAEEYSDYSGVHSVYSSRELAQKFIDENGQGPHGDDEFLDGYFISGNIEEYEVDV